MDMIPSVISTCLRDEISTVSAWDAFNGTLLARYRGGGTCQSHGLSTSGGYILSCEQGKPMLHLWQFNKQHCENKRLLGPGKVGCVSFSSDSFHIALSVDEKVHLYQTSSGRLLGIGARHFQPVTVMKFSDDNSLLCCGGKDGLVTVWKLNVFCSTGKAIEPFRTFSEHSLPVSDLVFTSGNIRGRVLSVSVDRTCKVFDIAKGKVLLSVVFESRLSCLAISPVELEIYVGNLDGKILEFSLRNPPRMLEYHMTGTDASAEFLGHEKTVNCLVCTIDCCNLISGSEDETIKVWHIASRQCIRTIPQKGPVTNIEYLLLSKNVFSHDYKPSAIVNDFRNPANIDEDEEASFDIIVSQNLLPPLIPTSGSTLLERNSTASNDNEVDKLKSINNAIYKFAINHLINKKPLDGSLLNQSFHKKKQKKKLKLSKQ